MSSGEHEVNFAVAQYADGKEEIFAGYHACDNFCSWLFTAKHKGCTQHERVIIFIFNEIFISYFIQEKK